MSIIMNSEDIERNIEKISKVNTIRFTPEEMMKYLEHYKVPSNYSNPNTFDSSLEVDPLYLPKNVHIFTKKISIIEEKYKLRNRKLNKKSMRKNEPLLKNSWFVNNSKNESGDKKLYSTINGILNKLSDKNFESLFEELTTLNVENKEQLNEYVKLVFIKAIKEPSYSDMYSRLCKKLSIITIDENITFRELLLNKCQDLFITSIAQVVEPDNTMEKMRILGNMKFIGELYNQELLTNNIIYGCFLELFKNVLKKHPIAIECIIKLMTAVGKIFLERDKNLMTKCLDKIKKIKASDIINKRDKFMIMDLEDEIKKWN